MPVTEQAYPSSQIFESLRLRLRSKLELDDSFVRLVASDQYSYSGEPLLIAIRPLHPQPYPEAGGGRRIRPTKRMVRVYISTRSSLDFVGDDRLATTALLDLEDKVYDALDDYWLRDESDTVNLTIEPIHPIDTFGGPPTRKPNEDTGEIFSRLDFQLSYLLVNLTPTQE